MAGKASVLGVAHSTDARRSLGSECSCEENLAFFKQIADNASSFPGGSELAAGAVTLTQLEMIDPEGGNLLSRVRPKMLENA